MAHDYTSAAHRHLRDVDVLRRQERWDNVGYLSGYVAECGVKAVIEMAGIAFRKHLPQISPDHLLLVADLSLAARRYPMDLDPGLSALRDEWRADLRYTETGTLTKPDALRLCGLAEGVYHRTINAMILDGFIERPLT
jgi:hypothetical protein